MEEWEGKMLQNRKLNHKKAEFTFAQLFEDMHNRIDLRNRISNTLMAISLYEVRSQSKNLCIYIEDGQSLTEVSLETLGCLVEKCKETNHIYFKKVFTDLLTEKGSSSILDACAQKKYKKYREGFQILQKLLADIEAEKGMNEKTQTKVKEFLMALDREIEVAYKMEDSLYFGYFRRIPLTT